MKTWFNRNAQDLGDQTGPAPSLPFAQAGRACCCPGRPAVTVLMPPSGKRSQVTDLLLCGHHFRVSRAALREAGAFAYDAAGRLVLSPALPDQPPSWDLGTESSRAAESALAHSAHPEHPAGSAYR
jgi:hypothetical protein